ncbi:MAG TPA: hypothetical protein DCY06_00390 [Bacteroidetes bacterium]|nr:hypothetical protein [Bacteroidota bacterium]
MKAKLYLHTEKININFGKHQLTHLIFLKECESVDGVLEKSTRKYKMIFKIYEIKTCVKQQK